MAVSEYAPCGELFEYIMFSNGFGEIATRTYGHQMMDGLNAMHNMGYTHGNLTPKNILLDKNFVLKISDFGHSQNFADYYTRNEIFVKNYRAPEMLCRKPYTYKADIFAVGAILFTLYCGFAPFEKAQDTDWWWKRLSKGTFWIEKSKKYLANDPKKNKRYTVAGVKLLVSFWDGHTKKCPIDQQFQELMINMLHPWPERRFNYKQISNHAWYNKKIMTQPEIEHFMRDRIKLVIKNRNKKVEEIVKNVCHNRDFCPNKSCRCGRIHGNYNNSDNDTQFTQEMKESMEKHIEKKVNAPDPEIIAEMNQVT